MSSISIEPALQMKVEQLARFLGRPPEAIVEEAINEHLDQLGAQKLDAEISAFERMHPTLKEKYLDQFVAVHDGQVIDSDAEFEPLFLRIQARLGDLAVLMRQVGESPEQEWHFRSLRMEYS
jgi:predicted DNA-binding protein